jgi:heptosyltransferase-1
MAGVREGEPRSLLVVRLGAMGDVIHTMATVAALRAAFSDLEIGWVIEKRWVELLCSKEAAGSGERSPGQPLVDRIHLVNTKQWRKAVFAPETRLQVQSVFAEIRAHHYDLAVDFQGAMKSAMVARFAGTGATIGMAQPREAPARVLYSKKVSGTGAHVIEQYHSLAEAVAGRKLAILKPEFPIDAQAEESVSLRLGGKDVRPVILTPGAGWATKQWPAERYGEVARVLTAEGLRPVINFAPGEEALAKAVETASKGAAIGVGCSISELIALTRCARMFIGGDTGPLHLAAALGVPVVAIFGPTDPARNGPYGTKNIVLRNAASRNALSHTSDPDPGLLQITSEQVISAVHQLLESAHA